MGVRRHVFGIFAGLVAASCAPSSGPSSSSDVSGTAPPGASGSPATSAAPADTGATADANSSSSDAVVAEVQRELGLLVETHYQHETHVVESEGVFDVDCSGFADYVLAHAASRDRDALAAASHTRPVAADYVTFFGALPASAAGWRPVTSVSKLLPGDMIAWLIAPKAGSDDTGHVMIVREAPRSRDASSYIVPVWDSVAAAHGSTDSRAATNATGIGSGEIVLLVDDSGSPNGHEWYDGGPQVLERTAMGRAR